MRWALCAQVNEEIAVRQDFILSVQKSFASSSSSVNWPPCALTRAFAIHWHTSLWLNRRSESYAQYSNSSTSVHSSHIVTRPRSLFWRLRRRWNAGDGNRQVHSIYPLQYTLPLNAYGPDIETNERGSQNIQHVSIPVGWTCWQYVRGRDVQRYGDFEGIAFCIVIRSFELISTHPKHTVSHRRLRGTANTKAEWKKWRQSLTFSILTYAERLMRHRANPLPHYHRLAWFKIREGTHDSHDKRATNEKTTPSSQKM